MFEHKAHFLALPLLLAISCAASAQQRQAPDPSAGKAYVIAIPPLATAKITETEAGDTWVLANQIADLISSDLKSTGRFIVADIRKVRIPSFPEVTAPAYPQWRAANAKLLLSGFVNARSDGRIAIGCYVYDVQSGRELARQGFALNPGDWRRAAHLCADAAYSKVTGNPPLFDTKIAYVAQSGPADIPVKRLAVMDFDGANHGFLTEGQSTVVGPRWSPAGDRIAYTSFADGRPEVRIVDVSSKNDRSLLRGAVESFAPAFSPDGERIALSIATNGNTDIHLVPADGAFPQQLTASPAVDTSPAFSPDGRRIAFVSDRSGSPQLYVMNSDGSEQRRVSFGRGDYGSPSWSPDGNRLAFTNALAGSSRIGVMNANGSEERILTSGPQDEQPSWSPDGERVLFQRLDPAARRTGLASVPVAGGDARPVPTPQAATDPAWSTRKEQGR
ncbi:MAG: Tol-Pal system beta propeller repeat protein TolB [Alphaproteobacteria bacterium]